LFCFNITVSKGAIMSRRYPVVEDNLRQVAGRWKWLRLIQHTATIGSVVSLLALLIGVGINLDRISDRNVVIVLISAMAIGALVAWVIIALRLLAEDPERQKLASGIERVNRSLLDRLNTLIFLEKSKDDFRARSFSSRIAKQTQQVLTKEPARFPFSSRRPLMHVLVFAALLAATSFLFDRYAPWQHLVAAEEQRKLAQQEKKQPEQPDPEVAPPETNLVETNRLWGEIRITEPGRDLRVTKLDSVPLQIEAAANERLERVAWRSAINDGAEQLHELPAPAEPRYAAYKPVIDIAALGLSEWDVLTYYAKADTSSSNSYASEVFFLEVRPFQEDIKKVPGAGSGKGCYSFLKRLSELIQQQQHVIRETHHHVQRSHRSAEVEAQDRNKLAEAESDLGDSVKHLSAEMAALDKQIVAPVLNDLDKATEPLALATGSLQSNALPEAQKQERDALQRLVATRKHFQKVISENPGAFSEESDPEEDQKTPPDAAKDKLKQITEFRNEAKAAQDFLDKAVEKQQSITQRASARTVDPKLSQEETELQKSIDRFKDEHPQIARQLERDVRQARQALGNAAQSLQQKSKDAAPRTQKALEELTELSQAMKNQASAQQLADAYKLKQMLDQQIRSLGQCENSPGSFSSAQGHQLAADSKGTLNQLKSLAEQQPTRDAFDQPLRDALNDKNKGDLDTRLGRFEYAQGDEAKKQAAAAAKEGLEKVSQAFNDSLPEALKAAEKNDPLKQNPSDSLQKGLDQLEKLVQQMENKGQKSPENQARQGREALFNLQQGIKDLEGSNEQTRLLLVRLEEELKKREPAPDLADFRKLLEQLQKLSAEVADRRPAKEEKPQVTNIDAARVSPTYRARVEKYFQRLSER
jgi:hypothetical protein